MCRKDKRAFVEELASQDKHATERSGSSAVYKITKQLCGGTKTQPAPIKDKSGNTLST